MSAMFSEVAVKRKLAQYVRGNWRHSLPYSAMFEDSCCDFQPNFFLSS